MLYETDVFNKFTGNEGKLKQNQGTNTRALMELFEASQLSIEGEDTLEVAGNFSGHLLNAMLSSTFLNDRDAIVVSNTLQHPYHKSLAKFTGENFLRHYNGPNLCRNVLQQLVKTDFDMAHSIHQKELVEISG